MHKGFVSKDDRIILSVLNDDERSQLLARARQKVVADIYTTLKGQMARLGMDINGHAVIYEDGRIRCEEPIKANNGASNGASEVNDGQLDGEAIMAAFAPLGSQYSYASLARAVSKAGPRGFTVTTGAIKGWCDGTSKPTRKRHKLAAQAFIEAVQADKRNIIRVLQPVGGNRA